MRARGIIVIFAVLFMLMITSVVILNNKQTSNINQNKVKGISGNAISKDDLASALEKENVMKDLPKDAKLNLRLYNFNSGIREWEKDYKITKGSVNDGLYDNPDAMIIIHSKYFDNLKPDESFCNVISKAKQNGDIGVEVYMSKALFFFKYREILKYEDCFN